MLKVNTIMKHLKNLLILIFLLLLNMVSANVVIYKIWSPYDPPSKPIYHIDLNEQTLYLGIVNRDEYAHEVTVRVEANGKTWEYGPIYLKPNTHVEHVVEVKVPISKDGPQDVKISLLENGKVIASKTVKVSLYFPVDVANVTCYGYPVKDGEVCYSPWFTVTLKSNPVAQTDYQGKVWIVVKSGNKVIYNGINDSKEVYIPLDGEVNVDFRIPNSELDQDSFKIETYVKIMNITHSVEGYEKTTIKREKDYFTYEYERFPKTFYFPIIIDKIELYNKVDENTTKYIKEFYRNVDDEDFLNKLDDRYYWETLKIPRQYVKGQKVISFIKVYLKNRLDRKLSAKLVINYNDKEIEKVIDLKKFEEKSILLPLTVNPGNLKIVAIVWPIGEETYKHKKVANFNINPEKVSPIIIKEIIPPKDKLLNDDGILVGKKYNITLILYNMYNKKLKGTVESITNVPESIVNISKKINFTIKPYETKKVMIPIICNREFNGDIKFKISTDKGVKDIWGAVHINAYLPVKVSQVYYQPPGTVKINKIDGGALYIKEPIAGKENKVYVVLNNPLSRDINCKVWVEVIDREGKVRAKTNVKSVKIPKLGEKEVEFNIFFNEGFTGYTIVHVIPEGTNVDIIFSRGLVKLCRIPNTIEIGRYSNVDVLGKEVNSRIYLVTQVYSPITIESLNYSNGSVTAVLKNEHFPTNLTFECGIENSNKVIVTLAPKEVKKVEIPVDHVEKKLRFYVKLDKFLLINGKPEPLVIFRDLEINISKNMENNSISKNESNLTQLEKKENNQTQIEISENSSSQEVSQSLNVQNSTSENLKNISSNNSNSGILGFLYGVVSGVVSTIFSIFRGG